MLRTYFQETFYDMDVEIARKYAEAIKAAIVLGQTFEGEKQQGFFISKKRGFEDKLYIGNIKRIENRLEWNGEELAEDDEIINVVMIDGPVTRDGDGCSYGSKDHRDQIMYANLIPQVVGHIFIINTPGGAASARIDYEQAIADCREKGKPTVAWVDGMCCSAGQLVASLCDRTVVMNGRHTMGCIGTMCAFWGVANGTVDKDGYRYIELVSVTSPDKNAEYREACDGKTEKLQAELDALGEEFRQTVKANRPLVKEEHLTGKTFDAQDVMGALVDEIGDYTRAIECVFELAGGTMPAARTAVPGEEPAAPAEGEENEEMAKLTEQQKAAIFANRESDLTVDDGKVEKTVDTPFGPKQQEIGNPQNSNNMTKEEEMKAQEAAAAQAAAQDNAEQPEVQEETPATGEAPAETPANEEPVAPEEPETPAEEPATPEAPAAEEPAAPEAPASEEAIADAQAEIDKIQETLHNAETMIADKDKTIAGLKEALEANNATIADRDKEIADISASLEKAGEDYAERGKALAEAEAKIADLQATIEAQKKQLAEKEAEIKELADKPAPMTDAAAGVPAGNGTGEAPKQKQCKYHRGMDYRQYLAAAKEQ